MKVVFIKNNDYLEYEKLELDGYKFIPRRRDIDSLLIIDFNLTKDILNKKLKREIRKVDKTVKLIINSDFTIPQDCDMMIDELMRLVNIIKNKYVNYFDEFEFFDFVKKIYILNMIINLKKKLLNNEGVKV